VSDHKSLIDTLREALRFPARLIQSASKYEAARAALDGLVAELKDAEERADLRMLAAVRAANQRDVLAARVAELEEQRAAMLADATRFESDAQEVHERNRRLAARVEQLEQALRSLLTDYLRLKRSYEWSEAAFYGSQEAQEATRLLLVSRAPVVIDAAEKETPYSHLSARELAEGVRSGIALRWHEPNDPDASLALDYLREIERRAVSEDEAVNETREMSALMTAWAIIANVSEGDWTRQPQEWQDAAKRWRDEQFHPLLDARAPVVTPSGMSVAAIEAAYGGEHAEDCAANLPGLRPCTCARIVGVARKEAEEKP